jgi:hypothetical protein
MPSSLVPINSKTPPLLPSPDRLSALFLIPYFDKLIAFQKQNGYHHLYIRYRFVAQSTVSWRMIPGREVRR